MNYSDVDWLATDITAEEFKNMIDRHEKYINETCDKAILKWKEAQEHNKNTLDPKFKYKWVESPESINAKRKEALELIRTWRAELEILREHEEGDRRAKNWTPLNAPPREYQISLELMRLARLKFNLEELSSLKLCFNHESGNVYLLDEFTYDTFMINSNKELEEWIFTPYAGHEGFLSDLINQDKTNWHQDDVDFVEYKGGY